MKRKNILLLTMFCLVFSNSSASVWDFLNFFNWYSKKTVTFLVYIAGDNNLNEFIADDLQEMQKVGSNKNVNCLVYLNTKFPGQPKVSRKLVIHKGYITQHGKDKKKDSGDPKTVISACKWAIKHFPSEQFIIVFWNHGSGSLNRTCARSVCYDDTTGNYLTDNDLQEALQETVNMLGKKIDIVAFDACLMADLEISYAIKNYADYMVASQETIPGTGWGYDHLLKNIAKRPVNTSQLVKMMVQAYDKEYNGIANDYTLSGINLHKIDILTQNTNRIAQTLKLILQDPTGRGFKIIQDSLENCTTFDEKYIDMFHFYTNLLQRIDYLTFDYSVKKNLHTLLEEGLNIICKSIIDYVSGPNYPQSHGLSIYFDQKEIDTSYRTTVWARESQWLSFLEMYQTLRENMY